MIYYQEIKCPLCETVNLGKAGKSTKGVQRYFCKNETCSKHTFMLEYDNKACELGVKERVIDMAINGSGIRDTSRVLHISKTTIMRWIKKKAEMLVQVNPNFQIFEEGQPQEVILKPFCEEA